MPGSRTHDILTVVTGVFGTLPATWILLPDHNIAAAFTITGAHLVSGMAFSPDLDLDSEPYKRWGPMRILWYPYREAIGHRSWISHSLVAGPLLRLGYFLLMCLLLLELILLVVGLYRPVDSQAILDSIIVSIRELWSDDRSYIVYFLLGFISGGAVHTLADWITTVPDPMHGNIFRSRRRSRRRGRDDEWGIF